MCCHEFLGQTAVSFTIVNKCYFCLRQQFSDAFCISTPEICLGWSHHVLRRPGGDAVWQPRYQTLTRHTVSLNTPCLISSCTPPRSVTLWSFAHDWFLAKTHHKTSTLWKRWSGQTTVMQCLVMLPITQQHLHFIKTGFPLQQPLPSVVLQQNPKF